ncbi:MAG: hypothetical protein ACI4MR_02285, partial [Candidatus Aphodomorpha sp.]
GALQTKGAPKPAILMNHWLPAPRLSTEQGNTRAVPAKPARRPIQRCAIGTHGPPRRPIQRCAIGTHDPRLSPARQAIPREWPDRAAAYAAAAPDARNCFMFVQEIVIFACYTEGMDAMKQGKEDCSHE